MRKRAVLASLCALSAVSTAGCADNYSKLGIKKVTDYLYEAKLDDDFDYSTADEYYKEYMPDFGGCSTISIGNFRGRNYDWEYSEGTEFIVRTSAKTGANPRHASIGISSMTDVTNEEANDGQYHDLYRMLPFVTIDGINDAGIYVNINVVGFMETGKWGMKTEDTSDDHCELLIPRLILDKCATLSDIPSELDKIDWFPLGNAEETHFMVTGQRSASDRTVTTVVFEFIPFAENGKTFRKLCCVSNNEDDVAIMNNDASRFYKINVKNLTMTNFNLWNYNPSLPTRNERLDTASPSPMGYERYEHLEAAGGNLDSVTRNQMFDIMKQVYFSNAYNLFEDNFWYSDYSILSKEELKNLTEEEMNPHGDIEKVYRGTDDYAYKVIKYCINNWNSRNRAAADSLWETVHTSVFDYENKSFAVVPHEGSISCDFKL